MKKCIVTGIVNDDESNNRTGGNRFWVLNEDIEVDTDGNEVYVCSCMKKDSSELENVYSLVKDMTQPIQAYIAVNKRFIENEGVDMDDEKNCNH